MNTYNFFFFFCWLREQFKEMTWKSVIEYISVCWVYLISMRILERISCVYFCLQNLNIEPIDMMEYTFAHQNPSYKTIWNAIQFIAWEVSYSCLSHVDTAG